MKKVLSCLCLVLATNGYAQEQTPEVSSNPVSTAVSVEATVSGNDAQTVVPPFRDPTVPSQKILERLRPETPSPAFSAATPVAAADERPTLPDIVVKAIVMADRDHGVAMLECGGRKLTVRLSREQLRSRQNGSNPGSLNGFTVQGQRLVVEDFSDTSLLLSTGDRTLLIQ